MVILNREFATLALNASTIFYLVHYLPQILTNRRVKCLQEMSVSFHGLLFLCYLTDLIYAMKYPMPWQYQLVSMVGLVCLVYQHIQLSVLFKLTHKMYWLSVGAGGVLLALVLVGFASINQTVSLYFASVAQVAGLIYLLPQICKNRQLRSAKALSGYYLLLNLGCILCDNIAAWGLAWSLPNKIGAGFRLLIVIVLIGQYWAYRRFLGNKKDNTGAQCERLTETH